MSTSQRIAEQFFRMGGTFLQLEKTLPHGCQPRRESLCDSLAWVGAVVQLEKALPHGWIFRGIADIIEKRSATKNTVGLHL
jgi:hypothetical protein